MGFMVRNSPTAATPSFDAAFLSPFAAETPGRECWHAKTEAQMRGHDAYSKDTTQQCHLFASHFLVLCVIFGS